MDVPYGTVLATIAADLCKEVCDISSDKWHHADESDYLKVSEGRDGTYAVRAKCKYCHKEFIATGLTPDSLSTAYSDYVSTLPAQGYDSAGTLLWQPNWSDISNWASFKGISAGDVFSIDTTGTLVYGSAYDPDFYSPVSINGSVMSISVAYGKNGGNGLRVGNADNSLYFSAPVSGTYFIIWDTPVIEYSWFTIDGSSLQGTSTCGQWYSWASKTKGTTVSKGSNVSAVFANRSGSSGGYMGYTNFSCTYRRNIYYRTPVFRVYPSVSSITNNYTLNTRVNNFNGDYYNSVTNNYYNNTTIVNETTNNYYDMTTNNNYTMSNWSYDYASRTYFITLEDGTTVTVQFGDDCMTITKNDVTNSYQYVIKNNSTPDTPTTCKHDWQETIDTAPTCLEGGHASYTCSLCGETYEQNLAAKGHDWKVKEHVNTVYNADGTVETQGHTLYECSVCGEQWYTDTGAPPPDVSGSSNILAWLQEFKIWLGDKLDNLFSGSGGNTFWTTTKDTVADVLSSLLETLLSFITDILGAILDLVKELLSFFFELISSVVISGISGFFSGLKDSRLFDFVQKDEDGSAVALPDGIATVFAFFSGVLLALPVELRSLLFFGTALVVLIGVINIIRS